LGLGDLSDPSYHLPHFYELFALWADKTTIDGARSRPRAARSSARHAHPKTGLAPDYADFDGVPVKQGDHYRFEYDAWRGRDEHRPRFGLVGKDPWQREEWAPTYLSFFSKLGVSMHPDQF
jgi:oligosaccharide reducing-end xylanase